MPHVTTIVTKLRFVGSHSQAYYDILNSRLAAGFWIGYFFRRSIVMIFWQNHILWVISLFYLARLIRVTQKHELQTSGISSKAINHPSNKALLVFAQFFTGNAHRTSIGQVDCVDTTIGQLTKLEYHAGFKKLSNELRKVVTANVTLHLVLCQKSEINLNYLDVLLRACIDLI